MADNEEELLKKFDKAKELMNSSIKVKGDIKIAQKAKKDSIKRIVDELQIDPGFVKSAVTMLSTKGLETGDTLATAFNKIGEIITTFKMVGMLEEIQEYIDGLNAQGISIAVECDKTAAATVKDNFKDSISYTRNIKDMQKIISDEHAISSEEMTWAPKAEYKGVLKAYMDKLKGKEDADDDIHDKVAYFEMAETAYNLVEGVEAEE